MWHEELGVLDADEEEDEDVEETEADVGVADCLARILPPNNVAQKIMTGKKRVD